LFEGIRLFEGTYDVCLEKVSGGPISGGLLLCQEFTIHMLGGVAQFSMRSAKRPIAR
jgi:hypothetical protein